MKSEKVREQAFRDYQEGMKYKEIAEKYGVSLSTQPKKRVKEPLRKMLVKYWKMLI